MEFWHHFPEIVPELQCQYDFCRLPRRAVFWVSGNRTGIGVLATFFPDILPELQCQYDFCGSLEIVLALEFWQHFSGNSTRTPMPIRFGSPRAPGGFGGGAWSRLDAPRGAPGSNFDTFPSRFEESSTKQKGFGQFHAQGIAGTCAPESSSLKGISFKNQCLFGASNFAASWHVWGV